MITNNSFKWKHFKTEIILLNIRWYLKYALSFRDLVEMMSERGLFLAHTTIMRWVHEYAPEINKKIRKYLKPSNDSWRVDETYVKIKGVWYYLYRAIDSQGIRFCCGKFHLNNPYPVLFALNRFSAYADLIW